MPRPLWYIPAMIKRYRLDPNNPRQLTPEEARQLHVAPIDFSDIPPLDGEFFAKARRDRLEPDQLAQRIYTG
jgi:hypothetical protein